MPTAALMIFVSDHPACPDHAVRECCGRLCSTSASGDKLGSVKVLRHPGSASGSESGPVWRVLLPAAIGLVLATPVATWWLVGPLHTAPARVGLDYAYRPWPISPAVARAAGITATAFAVVGLTVLIWATARRLLDARWWAVLLPLLAAGFIAGAGWREMTAGVLGSNIGAGFVVLVGWPVIAILVAWALGYSFHLARHGHRGKPYLERMLWTILLVMVVLVTAAVWR